MDNRTLFMAYFRDGADPTREGSDIDEFIEKHPEVVRVAKAARRELIEWLKEHWTKAYREKKDPKDWIRIGMEMKASEWQSLLKELISDKADY